MTTTICKLGYAPDGVEGSEATCGGGGTDAGTPQGEDSATLSGHTLPTSLACNQVTAANVTFVNSGTSTWTTPLGYRLGGVDDADPFRFARVDLIDTLEHVDPLDPYTFTFQLTAPASPGTYITDWRMFREGVHWFGDTAASNVTVSCAASATSAAPSSTSGRPGSSSGITSASSGSALSGRPTSVAGNTSGGGTRTSSSALNGGGEAVGCTCEGSSSGAIPWLALAMAHVLGYRGRLRQGSARRALP